jgi:hypothetical protein
MNSLERTLIGKAGYDNGWEVLVESVPSMFYWPLPSTKRRRVSLNQNRAGGVSIYL